MKSSGIAIYTYSQLKLYYLLRLQPPRYPEGAAGRAQREGDGEPSCHGLVPVPGLGLQDPGLHDGGGAARANAGLPHDVRNLLQRERNQAHVHAVYAQTAAGQDGVYGRRAKLRSDQRGPRLPQPQYPRLQGRLPRPDPGSAQLLLLPSHPGDRYPDPVLAEGGVPELPVSAGGEPAGEQGRGPALSGDSRAPHTQGGR